MRSISASIGISAVLLAGQLVYPVTYGLETEQSIMIGIGMGLFATARRRSHLAHYGAFTPAYVRRAPRADLLAPAGR